MKILVFATVALFAAACAVFVPPRPGHKKHHLLGEKECTYGPSYWCESLTNAGDCHATKHCIQTVWLHKQYPEDSTSICDTCKDMVKQARDQLESNETQELIKEVFEGSCALLHLKPIVKECDKIADDYIPDLIDTLASEMNPQTVCAIAGLCNNPRVHQLLEEAGQQVSNKPTALAPRNRCDDCNTVMDIVVDKFKNINRDDLLESLLRFCGDLGSFSDACSNIVINNFQDINSYLRENMNAGDLCLLSGECYTNFHKHHIEITPMSKIGYVPVNGATDDLPCELCEQLVTHLREVLVANTTEAEFKQVLEGICKQTKPAFSKECLSIVDQYYDVIYQYLVNGLNATSTCQLINICPRSVKNVGPLAPLLPVETAQILRQPQHVYIPKEDIVVKVIKPKTETPIMTAQDMQLPIDLLVPPHQQVYNQQFCVFCQYFLHYVQNEITDPTVEDDIKKVIDEACSKLPKSVNETCVEFVNTYEPALVAILAQEIDPSQVCPLIRACPSAEVRGDVDIFMRAKSSSKCPLCLYAVTELEAMMKGKKTKEEVKECLDELCDRLPGNLKPECTDFVNTYTDELVEMLVADFSPQEVCVYLKLCTDQTPIDKNQRVRLEFYGGDTETNAIYDNTIDGKPVEQQLGDEKCVLCEFIMKEVDDELKDKKTDDEIKAIVRDICKELPGTIKDSCTKFVDQYADAIIILLQETMDPSSICSYLKLCQKQGHPLDFLREDVTKCGVCRTAADIMQTILKNPKIDQSVEHIFRKTCRGMPSDLKKMYQETTLCKNGELDYVEAAIVLDLLNQTGVLQYQERNVQFFGCVACKLIVKAVTTVCKGHMTRAFIKAALGTVCMAIPCPIRSSCQEIVHSYTDKLADLIAWYGGSVKVCQLTMLCAAPSSIGDLAEDIGTDVDGLADERDVEIGECIVCKLVMKALEKMLKGKYAKDKIRNALTKVCKKVHSNKCQNFVRKHSDQIVNLVSKAATRGRVCKIIHVCLSYDDSPQVYLNDGLQLDFQFDLDESTSTELDLDKKKTNCVICKAVIAIVRKVIDSSTSRDKILEALKNACSKLRKFGSKCQSFVDQYSGKMVDLLLNSATRGKVCKLLKVCPKGDDQPLFVDDQSYESEENELEEISETGPFDFGKKKTNCVICKAVVAIVRKVIGSSPSRDKILEALKNACSKLRKFGSKCQSFVDQYSGKMVDLLLNSATRGKVCKLLKVCPKSDDQPLYVEDQSYESDENELEEISETGPFDFGKKKTNCVICKAVVAIVRKVIGSSPSRDKILEVLKNACSKLRKFGSKCQSFVDQYSGKMVDLLLNSATRGKVCKLLKVCPKADDQPLFVDDQSYESEENELEKISETGPFDFEKKKTNCVICKAVVAIVRKVIGSSTSRDKILEALKNACSKLRRFGSKCQSFVDQYSGKMVDLLLNSATRGKVCKLLKVCPKGDDQPLYVDDQSYESEENEIENMSETEPFEFGKKKTNCVICKAVVAIVRKVIGSSPSRDKILEALKNACSKLRKFGSKCQSFVDQYSGKMVDLLLNYATRGKVCKLLKVCPKGDAPPYESDENNLRISSFEHQTDISSIDNDDEEYSTNFDDYDFGVNKCTKCKLALRVFRFFVQNNNVAETIHQSLNAICEAMPPLPQGICKKEIRIRWMTWLRALRTINEGQVCHLTKMCCMPPGDSSDHQLGIDMCDSCQFVVNTGRSILLNGHTRHMIQQVIFEACDLLPHSLSNVCRDEVQMHWNEFLNVIRKVDGHHLCHFTGMCSSLPEFATTNLELGVCDSCQFVIRTMKVALLANFTTSLFEESLLWGCELFVHHTARDICRHEVDVSWKKFLRLVRSIDERRVCRFTGMCSSLPEVSTLHEPEMSTCEQCEFVIGIAQGISRNNRIAEQFHQKLNHLCSMLPKISRNICYLEIRRHWIHWLRWFRNLSVIKLCHSVRFCSAPPDVAGERDLESSSCEKCQFMVGLFRGLLHNAFVTKEIHQALAMVCTMFPHSLRSSCDWEVNIHWVYWVRWLQTFDVFHACHLTKFCSASPDVAMELDFAQRR